MSYPDPFTFVLDEIWKLLERKNSFNEIIPEENRIKLYGNQSLRRPQKDSLMETDVPEVMVFPSAMRFWENRDSSMASIHRIFAVMITSGERLVDGVQNDRLFPAEWAISRAMFDYETILSAEYTDPHPPELTETPVKKIEIVTADEGLSEDELNRDLKGWSAIWQAEVMMCFSYQMLKGG